MTVIGDSDFYSWDALLGINVDLLFLLLDAVIFLAILVGLDAGWIQRQTTETKYKLSQSCSVNLPKK